jgi:hypothetical protein
MYLEPLGNLQPDPHIEDWWVSTEIPISYLGGLRLTFTVDLESEKSPEELSAAIRRFLALPESARFAANAEIFDYYSQVVEQVGEEDFDFKIGDECGVWGHVHFTSIFVGRTLHESREIYVRAMAGCDWDEEHGLQIVLLGGDIFDRVESDQDTTW